MAVHCIRKLALQTLQTKTGYACWYLCPHSSRQFTTFLVQTTMKVMKPQPRHITPCQEPGPWIMLVKKFITTDVGEEETDTAQHRERKDPRARRTLGSIGRKIHHRIIQVIDENGENLGNLHRAEAFRMMDERGVKLVPLRENTAPPVYKLMTGKQIHEEQMKLREKQKNKSNTGPCQIKEQTFSADIAKHDLQTKIKQIQQWIEKKHHVRITVRKGTVVDKADKMEILLEEIAQSMHDKATYVSKPKVIKEGKAAMCILRHMSEKELTAYKQKQGAVSKHNGMSSKEEAFEVAKKDHEQRNGASSFATTKMNELSLGNRTEEKTDTTQV